MKTAFLTLLAAAPPPGEPHPSPARPRPRRWRSPARCTLFSSHRVRRMRWRIMVRLRPGPGFATLAELTVRWSRLAAIHHGRRARPSMRLHHRVTSRTTAYAIRLGRAQYGRRVFARAEDQTLILSLPGPGSPGCWVTGSSTIPARRWSPNPAPTSTWPLPGTGLGSAPSRCSTPKTSPASHPPSRWGMTIGCEDPAEAIRRAADLVDAIANAGEMAWWVEKSAAALAAGHARRGAARRDMGDMWGWSTTARHRRRRPRPSRRVPGVVRCARRARPARQDRRLHPADHEQGADLAGHPGHPRHGHRPRGRNRSTSGGSPMPAAPSTCSPLAGTAPRARRCSAASPPTSTAPPATTAWPSRTAGWIPGCCSRWMSCTCAPSTCPPGSPTRPARASRSPPWCTPPGSCATSTASTALPPLVHRRHEGLPARHPRHRHPRRRFPGWRHPWPRRTMRSGHAPSRPPGPPIARPARVRQWSPV